MKKKTVNKNIESSPLLKLFECETKKSNAPAILDYLSKHKEANMMKSLMPKGMITTSDINRQLIFDNKATILNMIENNKKKGNKDKAKITIYLTPDGTLYRYTGKTKLKYDAHGAKRRIQILRFLNMQNYNFVKTSEIVKQVGSPNIKALQKTVHDFNEMANIKLKLGLDIIDSKQASGYKVEPRYLIKNTEE